MLRNRQLRVNVKSKHFILVTKKTDRHISVQKKATNRGQVSLLRIRQFPVTNKRLQIPEIRRQLREKSCVCDKWSEHWLTVCCLKWTNRSRERASQRCTSKHVSKPSKLHDTVLKDRFMFLNIHKIKKTFYRHKQIQLKSVLFLHRSLISKYCLVEKQWENLVLK